MAMKRPRSTYESEGPATYAALGSPLLKGQSPFAPVWQQEARDERGRRRLHGAFTGGWTAGYFNTVGSKEGWTPSAFSSSRTNRRENDNLRGPRQRPEDYMDDEDLEHIQQAEAVLASRQFGHVEAQALRHPSDHALTDLLGESGKTKGQRLLQCMGWKEGQGIGPKTRRFASLDDYNIRQLKPAASAEPSLFAPRNVDPMPLIHPFQGKTGLGHGSLDSQGRLAIEMPYDSKNSAAPSTRRRGCLGGDILPDCGSDDDQDDAFLLGPRISYSRRSAPRTSAKGKPAKPSLFSAVTQPKTSLRRLGNLPRRAFISLPGFVCGSLVDHETVVLLYPPPSVPLEWESSFKPFPPFRGRNISSLHPSAPELETRHHRVIGPSAQKAHLGKEGVEASSSAANVHNLTCSLGASMPLQAPRLMSYGTPNGIPEERHHEVGSTWREGSQPATLSDRRILPVSSRFTAAGPSVMPTRSSPPHHGGSPGMIGPHVETWEGPLRIVQEFRPSALLCKRFGIATPSQREP